MSSKMRTVYIVILDYFTLLISLFITRLFLPDAVAGVSAYPTGRMLVTMATLLVVYPVVFKLFGVYRVIHRYAQYSEYLRFVAAFLAAGIVFAGCNLLEGLLVDGLSFSAVFLVVNVLLSAFGLLLSRLIYRVYVNRAEPDAKKALQNTLIVGCGHACLLLLSELKYHPEYHIKPVVAVDSDPAKKGRSIGGIAIEGSDKDIPVLCKKHNIHLIIVAIPSADNKQRAHILENCKDVDVEIKMLPRLADFYATQSGVVEKLRDFTMDELLGRDPIEVNHEEVSAFIQGKTVLVTGGGGSIGAELCRQIASNSPKKLIIVDIYENSAYDIQQELRFKYEKKLDFSTIIASVRDYERIKSILSEYKPDIVIHAAAHKHVPLMEVSPQEAIKNNVFGTYNTARAAIETGVSKFILISTDKAVNPTNIMGASKRMCEMIIQSMNGKGTVFSAVRFGNVLGSNGSVIPLFRKQIASGGPVTVTHPDIIRFFMTIPEAVQLVLMASAKAKGGEIFVLNMGKPVKIADLAKRIILLSGKKPDIDIKIKYTGLRPGEKLYEELMMQDENLEKTQNDKIFIGHFVDFDKNRLHGELDDLYRIANDNTLTQEQMLASLEQKITELVPTFHHAGTTETSEETTAEADKVYAAPTAAK